MLTDLAEILVNALICFVFAGIGYLIRAIQDNRTLKEEIRVRMCRRCGK